jgi:hypothetical protein
MKALNKESEKRAKINRSEYRPKARKFITANPVCKLQMKGCTGAAQGVHHTKGKDSTELLLDERWWLPACNWCNTQVEIKDAEARSKGLKLSKHAKE